MITTANDEEATRLFLRARDWLRHTDGKPDARDLADLLAAVRAPLEARIAELEACSVHAIAVAEAAAHYVEAKEDHSPGGYSLVRARFATLQRTLIAFASTGKTPEVGG
jgi:hypothetical protein